MKVDDKVGEENNKIRDNIVIFLEIYFSEISRFKWDVSKRRTHPPMGPLMHTKSRNNVTQYFIRN